GPSRDPPPGPLPAAGRGERAWVGCLPPPPRSGEGGWGGGVLGEFLRARTVRRGFYFGSGAVGSSVWPPCQSGAMFRLFHFSHAALRSATICGWALARSFSSPTSFARS